MFHLPFLLVRDDALGPGLESCEAEVAVLVPGHDQLEVVRPGVASLGHQLDGTPPAQPGALRQHLELQAARRLCSAE